MRLGTFVFAACALALPAGLAAQTYSRPAAAPSETVIRPMPTEGWRNYVTVPDGPCGCPMSVEADCYNGCPHCGPLQFLHRVKRVFDCFLPCNMCCRGGCGLFHGCGLGGRTWGHCSVCCGGGACGGCGGSPSCGGCCPNPCGSAFAGYAPSYGGHCTGCGSTAPGMSDPFQDDPVPQPPKPTAAPATEVRRGTNYRTQPNYLQMPSASAVTPRPSPYKVVSTPVKSSPARPANRQPAATAAPAANSAGNAASQSVLRRASADQETAEPAQLFIDQPRAKPIVRSQSPDEVAASLVPVPRNPLRN